MLPNRTLRLGRAVAVLVLIAGCGDDGSSNNQSDARPAADANGPVDARVDGMVVDAPPAGDAMVNDAMVTDAAACAGSTTMVINEVRYDLPGAGDAGNEWVELYNLTGSAIDIGDWKLQWGTNSFGNNELTIPTNTMVAANGYFVIGGSNVTAADLSTATLVNVGNASTAPDGVRIVDAGGNVIDTVLYGAAGTNTDAWMDDCGLATTWAPDTFPSQSLARQPNGQDTNSGTDFQPDSTPTMGAANN